MILRFIYETILISNTQPYLVNKHGLHYLYVYSPVAMVMVGNEYGGEIIAQNQWNFIAHPEGSKLYSPTYPLGVYIITLSTDQPLSVDGIPRTGLNAYERSGQAYSATTGWQRVGTISNFVALQLVATTIAKNIHITRIIVATELATAVPVFVSQVNNDTVIPGMGSAYDSINNIGNHAINLSFASGLNFQPLVKIYASVGGTGVTALSGISSTVHAVANGTLDILNGTTRLVQKGSTASLVVGIRMPDTTHMASVSYEWYEEV